MNRKLVIFLELANRIISTCSLELPYSQDFAPNDFWALRLLKKHLETDIGITKGVERGGLVLPRKIVT